jgi:hypothetical protein
MKVKRFHERLSRVNGFDSANADNKMKELKRYGASPGPAQPIRG